MVDLVLRERCSTSDPVVATRAVQAVLGVGQVTTDGGPFAFEQRSLVDDGISVTRIASSGTDVVLNSIGSPDLTVAMVRSGALRMAVGEREVGLGVDDLGLIPFAGAMRFGWDRVAVDFFTFPLSSFGRALGAAGNRISVSAPLLAPQSDDLATLWRQMATVVAAQVLDRPGLYERDVVRGQMIDALTAITVEAFGLVNSEETGSSLQDDAVRRAESYMQARLGEPIAIPDIAANAGLSVRGLQLLYQQRYETTPVSRLRLLRLEGAHAALRSPGTGTTVSAVAQRFGYSNLGRFSAHYRDLYGEQPSRTLQIARVGDGRDAHAAGPEG